MYEAPATVNGFFYLIIFLCPRNVKKNCKVYDSSFRGVVLRKRKFLSRCHGVRKISEY